MTASLRYRAIEFVYWVLAVTVGTVAVALVVGLLAGLGGARTLLTAKKVLFVVGFLLFAVGAFSLKPKPPHETSGEHESDEDEGGDEDEAASDGEHSSAAAVASEIRDRSVFEDEWFVDLAVQKLPPLRSHPVPLDERVGRLLKLFVAGILVLAISIYMGVGLGITAT